MVDKLVLFGLILCALSDKIFVAINNNGNDNRPFLYHSNVDNENELNWNNFRSFKSITKSLAYNIYMTTIEDKNFLYYINSDNIANLTLVKIDVYSEIESVQIFNFGCNPNLYYCDSILNYRIKNVLNGSVIQTVLEVSSAVKNRNNGIKYLTVSLDKLKNDQHKFNEIEWDIFVELSSNFRDRSEFSLFASSLTNTTNIITVGSSIVNNYKLRGIDDVIIYQSNLLPEKMLQFSNPTTKDGTYSPNLLVIDSYHFIMVKSIGFLEKWAIYGFNAHSSKNFSIIIDDVVIDATYSPDWVVLELKANFNSFESYIKDIRRDQLIQSFQLSDFAIYASFYLTNSSYTTASITRIIKMSLNSITFNNTENNVVDLIEMKISKITKVVDIPVNRLNPARIEILSNINTISPANINETNSANNMKYGTYFSVLIYIMVFLIVNKYYYNVIFS
jgi:hypothetical protein